MNATTGIEWTDATSNPVKYRDKETGRVVWACVKHSSGCLNCYAETLALRYGRGGPFTKAEMAKVEPFVDEKELRQLERSPKLAGKRCFVGDMTDVFGAWVTDAMLDRLFATFAVRQDVTFQVLTKRADRMRDYFAGFRTSGLMGDSLQTRFRDLPDGGTLVWPLNNVWLGVSVENQKAANERIPALLRTPAKVRFLSCEPLLGPVDLRRICLPAPEPGPLVPVTGHTATVDALTGDTVTSMGLGFAGSRKVGWVIVGGESGPGSRPFQVEWAKNIVGQCKATGVACFVKQIGSQPVTDLGVKDGSVAHWPHKDRKGATMEEWPEAIRVREFPAPACGE